MTPKITSINQIDLFESVPPRAMTDVQLVEELAYLAAQWRAYAGGSEALGATPTDRLRATQRLAQRAFRLTRELRHRSFAAAAVVLPHSSSDPWPDPCPDPDPDPDPLPHPSTTL